MDFFFSPRGVAVVGATPNPHKGGNAILKNLLYGYRGEIFPVNPKYREIEGLACYPDLASIPGPADLAILFVPAPFIPAAVEACAARGIRGAMIESGGFAETGPEGARLQKELADLARSTGIRLWGPNCMGLVDVVNGRIFSFMDPRAQQQGLIPGTVSLVVQSGMLSAGFLVDIMSHATMGISKVCSVGNKVDVNECDLLEYLLDDPDTRVVGLYLESIPEGRRFIGLCRKSKKPVVVLKGGRSRKGAEAAMSHTASLAGNQRVVSGAFAQAGVVEARDFKQMMDLCRSLALTTPRGGRDRVAVLTFSGGAGIVSTDFIEEKGLRLAELSPETRSALGKLFPAWMPVANPVDLWPAVERHVGTEVDVFGRALSAVLRDPEVDAVLLHAYVGNSRIGMDLPDLSARIREAGKPVFFWLLGRRDEAHELRKEALSLGLPIFGEISRAVDCLAAALRTGRRPEPAAGGAVAAPLLPPSLRERLLTASGPLDERVSKELLRAFGIPTVREEIVGGPAEAEGAAAGIGYPVVLKGLLPGSVHKTELGLVRLGIPDGKALRQAYEDLRARMETHGGGEVLLQRQVRGRVELILGLLRDPQFGPCVMFGLGGVTAEILDDTVFAVAPLTRQEALDLIGRIRGSRVLDGFRGAPPVDREEIARILIALGEIGLAIPRIREIDLNPLIVGETGAAAVDATVILE